MIMLQSTRVIFKINNNKNKEENMRRALFQKGHAPVVK